MGALPRDVVTSTGWEGAGYWGVGGKCQVKPVMRRGSVCMTLGICRGSVHGALNTRVNRRVLLREWSVCQTC